jgi:hypothetical protein
MSKTTSAALAVLALALAACGGGGDDDEAAASTTEPQDETLTARVTADQSGFGCTQAVELSGLSVGTDLRLTVTDEEGTTIGTGTFALSPGLTPGVDTCDWTAVVRDVTADADFYNLDADGELATFSRDELEAVDWEPELRITVSGDVVEG